MQAVNVTVKNIPKNIKELVEREADANRRSTNQEFISIIEEGLLSRAKSASQKRKENEAILREFSKMPVLDKRAADEIIGYDEFGLPK